MLRHLGSGCVEAPSALGELVGPGHAQTARRASRRGGGGREVYAWSAREGVGRLDVGTAARPCSRGQVVGSPKLSSYQSKFAANTWRPIAKHAGSVYQPSRSIVVARMPARAAHHTHVPNAAEPALALASPLPRRCATHRGRPQEEPHLLDAHSDMPPCRCTDSRSDWQHADADAQHAQSHGRGHQGLSSSVLAQTVAKNIWRAKSETRRSGTESWVMAASPFPHPLPLRRAGCSVSMQRRWDLSEKKHAMWA